MPPPTRQQNKAQMLTLSILSGMGITIFSLVIGTLLDYIVVQGLSQYFLSDCSEDCYFAYFNALFYVIALLSLLVGFVGGRRIYERFAKRATKKERHF